MELRHLRCFVGVAHHLNYSEASRRLYVAEPAISQTILDLEEELGVKLLFGTKRTVQLTAAGTDTGLSTRPSLIVAASFFCPVISFFFERRNNIFKSFDISNADASHNVAFQIQ